ncbi:MAG: acyl-CoA dehydratase activase-related protein [Bacillota bacterium]
MRVGIPRVLSFFYYFPFYKAFLERLGCEIHLSRPTNAATLENLAICPTDEPCISVKLAFPHTAELVKAGVNHLFVPILTSADRFSYYCPKHIGLPAMLRSGLGLPPEMVLAPEIDWRGNPRRSLNSLVDAGVRLGASRRDAWAAAREAGRCQGAFNRVAARDKLTYPEALEQVAGVKRFRRSRPYNPQACCDRSLRVGVVGHSYILYDYISHNLVDRLREHAAVLVPEMVPHGELTRVLHASPYGKELWSFEQLIVGSALYWLRHQLVDCLILVGPFECGPEAVVEVFLEQEADRHGIPLLIITVDEQTGEAGLVTRLEAFLDTVSGSAGGAARRPEHAGDRFIPPALPEKRVLGFPTLGKLGAALAAILSAEEGAAIPHLPITRRTTELGAALAPEFICYPLTVTIGQMRECLEAGANTLVMVGGKGRCRLGWYAELQEILLKRAGYDFEMVTIHSPLPLTQNFGPFVQVIGKLLNHRPWPHILSTARLAYSKAAYAETAEKRLFAMRARESERGGADRAYRRFERELAAAVSLAVLKKTYLQFREYCCSAAVEEGLAPFRVRLIGEIYAVFENFVNHEIARTLGSLPDVRVEVETEITILNWFRQNILRIPGQLQRHHRIAAAARPYLPEAVGGHGQDSVGLTVLAPRENVDGIIHLWPFTCMPEIIAQSILTRVVHELEIPLLTVIINEQTGEAGLRTRVESFAHILRERREERKVLLK